MEPNTVIALDLDGLPLEVTGTFVTDGHVRDFEVSTVTAEGRHIDLERRFTRATNEEIISRATDIALDGRS